MKAAVYCRKSTPQPGGQKELAAFSSSTLDGEVFRCDEAIDHYLVIARRLAEDGLEAWEQVKRAGYEGLVAKDASSTYLAGGPFRAWLKVKVRREGRFLIGGVVQRDDGCALLVGAPEAGALRFLGPVEFWVGRQLVGALAEIPQLARPTSPFADRIGSGGVTWLEPVLAAEITYAELMQGVASRFRAADGDRQLEAN